MIEQLQQTDLFNSLSCDELEKISTVHKFQQDNIVFYQGDPSEYFYFLVEGSVKVYKVDTKGTEIVVHNFGKNTLVAEMATIEEINFPATCICMKDSTFILIKRDAFLNILETNAALSFQVIKSLSKKIQIFNGLLDKNLIFDATAKVAAYISENPELFKTKKKKAIATELQMTPETFSRILKKLKDLKLIDNDLNILDKDKIEMFINF